MRPAIGAGVMRGSLMQVKGPARCWPMLPLSGSRGGCASPFRLDILRMPAMFPIFRYRWLVGGMHTARRNRSAGGFVQ
jgi:hypothetical protein